MGVHRDASRRLGVSAVRIVARLGEGIHQHHAPQLRNGDWRGRLHFCDAQSELGRNCFWYRTFDNRFEAITITFNLALQYPLDYRQQQNHRTKYLPRGKPQCHQELFRGAYWGCARQRDWYGHRTGVDDVQDPTRRYLLAVLYRFNVRNGGRQATCL